MLLVKTYMDKSPIHGVGLFADEFIKKGTCAGIFHPWIDFVLTRSQLKLLPEAVREGLEKYLFPYPFGTDIYRLEGDNGKFKNHSFEPNISQDCFALVDIPKGAELTVNYYQIDHRAEWLDQTLGAKNQ